MTPPGTTIRGRVASRALDKLLNDNGALTERGQQGVIDEYRCQLENVAGQKYNCGYAENGVISCASRMWSRWDWPTQPPRQAEVETLLHTARVQCALNPFFIDE
jgi:hypothetical protein